MDGGFYVCLKWDEEGSEEQMQYCLQSQTKLIFSHCSDITTLSITLKDIKLELIRFDKKVLQRNPAASSFDRPKIWA